jgi:rhamnose transport system substrate-binding protein
MASSVLLAKSSVKTEEPWREKLFPNHEWVLLLALTVECVIFGLTGSNFLTVSNAFEVMRLSGEIGLLALALTPIIITGGIDLSVGSMMGLSAVILGALWRDSHLSTPAAAGLTLLAGLLGGALNALLIARWNLPPLIVTLGSYSLFRGIAEGLTRGTENYFGFPQSFLFWGQGYVGGVFPAQVFVLIPAVICMAWLLHRTAFGRTMYAIGYSPEGARFAGVPVRRRLAVLYVLSGFASSLAGIIYVAHLGQAKSDAGTGYELIAITAVVLGGASIFGGRGTILGTVLGLYAIVILQNGLQLSTMPAELTGILTGALLLLTIAISRYSPRVASHRQPADGGEELQMKNSQVAVLSAVILIAAVIVASSNWWLVRSLRHELKNEHTTAARDSSRGSGNSGRRVQIAMMPKAKGDPYFISCRQGADEAAKELGADLLWDGPTGLDPAKQNDLVESWITKGVDVIAASVENKSAISTVLRKARTRGIHVITWDADAEKDARDFFVNQATPEGIGYTLTDEAARILNNKGEFAIITASLSAANQNEWIKYIKARLAEKYPALKLVAIQPSEGDRDRAFAETQTVLKVYPHVKLIMGIAAPAVPGAAEAVKQSGRTDVKVIGLSLPSMCRSFIKEGVIESIVLWNTLDLGYLTVHSANALATGGLKRGDRVLRAGHLSQIEVVGDEVRLGAPFIFNKSNIDNFSF